MKYSMNSGSMTVDERIEDKISKTPKDTKDKFNPKDPKPEKEKKFLVSEIDDLVSECFDVQANGGYLKIAHKYGIEWEFVRDLEKIIIEKMAVEHAPVQNIPIEENDKGKK